MAWFATVGFKSASAYSQFARRVIRSHPYVLDAESHEFLATLHEHVGSPFKTLRRKDARWQAGEFGLTRNEIARLRQMATGEQPNT